MKWIKFNDRFPDDWEWKIIRKIGNDIPINTTLFEHRNGRFQKLGGIGALEYSELEWLDENAHDTELLTSFGLWLSGQGYDKPDGIEYKVEIRGEVYSMENAVKMYLKSI